MDGTTSAFGRYLLDRAQRRLTRDGVFVPLNHRGYILLETLLDAEGEAVGKDVLMAQAWPDTVIEEGNLTVQISALRRQLGEDAGAIIVTVPRVGYRLITTPAGAQDGEGAAPRVAVLPFVNHGAATEDGYFADGVVEDIITALSRFKTFAVLSRGASFALGPKGTDGRSAAAAIGVRYALEGSIRRRGDRLRVTAQLFDTESGVPLWAETYDGATSEVFSFQDHITERVVGVVEPAIRKAEIERARRKPAANLDAYDLFLRALPLIGGPGVERHGEALDLLRRAASRDPGFALPLAYAAWIYEKRLSLRQPELDGHDRDRCLTDARTALRLGGGDPLVRAICGFVLYRVADDLSALGALRQAVSDNPNNVVILNLAGAGNRRNGAVDEAYRCYARAYDLSPGAPEAYQCLHGMGATEMMRGNYEIAIGWCQKSLATFNEWVFTYATLATCYVNLGRRQEAAAMVARIQALDPNLTVTRIADGADRNDRFAMMVIPGLREAGLPLR